MKKIISYTLITVAVSGLFFGVVFGTFKVLDKDNINTNPVAKAENSTVEKAKEESSWTNDKPTIIISSKTTAEEEIMQKMHEMTHQKVIAEDKWGVTEMSPKNIERIIEVLEVSEFDKKDRLMGIAKRWQKGDFSIVDRDHNYFWISSGGTVGEAIGIMTPEEEAEFIDKHF